MNINATITQEELRPRTPQCAGMLYSYPMLSRLRAEEFGCRTSPRTFAKNSQTRTRKRLRIFAPTTSGLHTMNTLWRNLSLVQGQRGPVSSLPRTALPLIYCPREAMLTPPESDVVACPGGACVSFSWADSIHGSNARCVSGS